MENNNYYEDYINKLQKENIELKETLKGTTHCYDEEEHQRFSEENEELKRRLNWLAFGDDKELALRYLKKIGYVDFDEKRKCYINKHNNDPFFLNAKEEKIYYLKDEELNEYTKQLQKENEELKKQVEIKNNGFLASIEEVCEYATILAEFEKWIEKQKENDVNEDFVVIRLSDIENKLQELKKRV